VIAQLVELEDFLELQQKSKTLTFYPFIFSFLKNDKFRGLFEYIVDDQASDIIYVEKRLVDSCVPKNLFFSFGKRFAKRFNEYMVYKIISNENIPLRINISIDSIKELVVQRKNRYLESILILDEFTKKELMAVYPQSMHIKNKICYFEDIKLVEINSKQLENCIVMIVPELVYCHFNIFLDSVEYNSDMELRQIRTSIVEKKRLPLFEFEYNLDFITVKTVMDIGLSFNKNEYTIFNLSM